MTGAIRLLDRSLSQQKTRPATNVTATEPSTSSTCPPVWAAAPANSRLSDIVCRVGAMCHRPNRADVIRLARQGPHSLSADPSRTPRKANSSGIAVSSTIDTPSSYSMRRLTDITAGPKSPNGRATANTASTATACPKQRPAFMGFRGDRSAPGAH
jgi:hypothetical protein